MAEAELRDGTIVVVRLLDREDFDSLVELADSLSADERYLRFFTAHPRYIAEWARSLTAPAPGVVALGAYDHGALVGVANYCPCDEPGQAELAVVVAHDQHCRGIGTALLTQLVNTAGRSGQHHLVAEVLFENHAMRRVINETHAPVTWHRDGSVYDVDLDLDALGRAEGRPVECGDHLAERSPRC